MGHDVPFRVIEFSNPAELTFFFNTATYETIKYLLKSWNNGIK